MLQAVLAVNLLALTAGLRLKAFGDAIENDSSGAWPAALSNGLVFIRPQKVGSSVFGGIARRVAFRNGLAHAQDRDWFNDEPLGKGKLKTPAVIAGPQHDARTKVAPIAEELMPGAFYVTMVREPIARCLSYFYYEVTRGSQTSTAEEKIRFMNESWACKDDFQFRKTRPDKASSVEGVLASYGTIGVTERFDESALLLSKKLGASLNDILYVRQKVSGASVNKSTGRTYVRHPPISEEPEAVRLFAASHFGGGLDEQLHQAADARVADGIAGYPGFQADLAEYRRRLAAVADRCDPQYAAALSDGDASDAGCFVADVGCGQPCIDSVIKDFQWA